MVGFRYQFLTFIALVVFTLGGSSAFAEAIKLTVLGDSLVAGYGLDPGQSFPDQLGKALKAKGHNVQIINAGVSGDTTSGGLSRLDWSVADGTQGVILELGANDALRGLSPDLSRKNLEAMIEKLKARGIEVLLSGMLAPPNMGRAYGEAFNSIYPELASKHDVQLYPFFLEGVAAIPELNLPDRIHPNPKGVAIMVANFLPAAEEMLAKIAGK